MICPKCKRSYNGSTCPYCDAPEIYDNTADYLKRKEIYKKRKAYNESEAESDKPAFRFKRKDKIALPEIDIKRILKKGKFIFIAAAAFICVLLIVCNLPKVYAGDVYIIRDGAVYGLSGKTFDKVESADGKSLVFDAGGDNFTYVNFPTEEEMSEITGDDTKGDRKQAFISQRGDFTAWVETYPAATYDGVGESRLFVGTGDGTFVAAKRTLKDISIKYVSDKGDVIFTETDIYDNELRMGAVSLHVFKAGNLSRDESGKQRIYSPLVFQLDDSVKDVGIYDSLGKILIRDSDNVLFLWDMSSENDPEQVDDEVTAIFCETKENNSFKLSDSKVVSGREADLLLYQKNNRLFLLDLKTSSVREFGILTDTQAVFVYDEALKKLLAVSGGYIKSSDEGAVDKVFDNLAEIKDQAYFLYNGKNFIFVNPASELISYDAGEFRVIQTEVDGNSLTRVNLSEGCVYKRLDGTLWYSKTFDKGDSISAAGIGPYVVLKDESLFYILNGEIFSLSIKNGEAESMGKADYIFEGSKIS